MSLERESIWLDYTVEVPSVTHPDLPPVSLCGLCGNMGIIKTVWMWSGDEWTCSAPCICPNGRAMVAHGRITDKVRAWKTGKKDPLVRRFIK